MHDAKEKTDKRQTDGMTKVFREFVHDSTQSAIILMPINVISFRGNAYTIAAHAGVEIVTKLRLVFPSMKQRIMIKKLNFVPQPHPDKPLEDHEHSAQ